MSTVTVRTYVRLSGTLTDATSVSLDDGAGVGVKRNDTDALVVAAGTAMTKVSTGVYEYTFTAPAEGLTYTYYPVVVYDSVTYGPFTLTYIDTAQGGNPDAVLGSITKAQIIAFCNKAWESSEDTATSTKFDEALQLALDQITMEVGVLRVRDTSQDIEAGDTSIAWPTGMVPGGLVALSLTDVSGNEYKPLEYLKGGLREYRQLRNRSTSSSRPLWFVEGEGNNWYLWPTTDQTYNVTVDYYRTHPQDVATILLPDPCRKALKLGTVFHEAVLRRNVEYQQTWGPLYARELEVLRSLYPGEPYGAYP
jgi:hypothetical protein